MKKLFSVKIMDIIVRSGHKSNFSVQFIERIVTRSSVKSINFNPKTFTRLSIEVTSFGGKPTVERLVMGFLIFDWWGKRERERESLCSGGILFSSGFTGETVVLMRMWRKKMDLIDYIHLIVKERIHQQNLYKITIILFASIY